jgi:hypothetical protein
MLNNIFGGLTGGAGGGDPTNPSPLARSSLFDDENAITDFTDHLPPVHEGATVTQEDLSAPGQEEAGETGRGPPAPAATPIPAPPNTGGGGGTRGGTLPGGDESYSGIGSVLQKLGHTMYDHGTLEAELAIQRGVNPGDASSCQSFKDFVVNVQQFRGYLAILGGKHVVTMLHTPGVYYSINPATRTYQGLVLAFIGDRRLTKEPTPVCLPTTKSWECQAGGLLCR